MRATMAFTVYSVGGLISVLIFVFDTHTKLIIYSTIMGLLNGRYIYSFDIKKRCNE